MLFLTENECGEFARALGFDVDELARKQSLETSGTESILLFFEEHRSRSFAIAKQLVLWLGNFRSSLLWTTDYGIWPSSENSHLYYTLRLSYGDHRLINQAPGHYFLEYETADLITFVDLSIQFGWGANLITSQDRTNAFISHDGWVRIESKSQKEEILREIEAFSIPYRVE
jgi:hypothetical protein